NERTDDGTRSYEGDPKPEFTWWDEFVNLEPVGDILEGGGGADLYVIDGGGLKTMDTIVDLNLDEDSISFARLTRPDEFDDADKGWTLGDWEYDDVVLRPGLTVEHVVHGGVIEMTGGSLEEAVQKLFESGSFAFEATRTNSVGLFQYGDDKYLIATGNFDTGSFGDDDIIVKLAGNVTGTLDISDFYQPWIVV